MKQCSYYIYGDELEAFKKISKLLQSETDVLLKGVQGGDEVVIQMLCSKSPYDDPEVLHEFCNSPICPNYKEFDYEM